MTLIDFLRESVSVLAVTVLVVFVSTRLRVQWIGPLKQEGIDVRLYKVF